MANTENRTTERFELNLPQVGGFYMKYYYAEESTCMSARVFPPHIHDCVELYVLQEGDVSFAVEGSLYHLDAGDMILTKPNEMHNCILNSDSPHRHFCFWFRAQDGFLLDALCRHGYGQGNRLSPAPEEKERLLSLCLSLYSASREGEPVRQYALAVMLLSLVRDGLGAPPPAAELPEVLRQILSDMDENFRSVENLSDLAERYFISHSTMGRLFRTYLGTSPKLYLETKRLAYSRQLLREGKSVTEACIASGFPDYSNYIRLFRRRFGMTPLYYRNHGEGSDNEQFPRR